MCYKFIILCYTLLSYKIQYTKINNNFMLADSLSYSLYSTIDAIFINMKLILTVT